jgi:hypothetical protein
MAGDDLFDESLYDSGMAEELRMFEPHYLSAWSGGRVREPREGFRIVEFKVDMREPRPDLRVLELIYSWAIQQPLAAIIGIQFCYHDQNPLDPPSMLATLIVGEPLD